MWKWEKVQTVLWKVIKKVRFVGLFSGLKVRIIKLNLLDDIDYGKT